MKKPTTYRIGAESGQNSLVQLNNAEELTTHPHHPEDQVLVPRHLFEAWTTDRIMSSRASAFIPIFSYLAHEFNNSLTAVLGYAQFLQEILPENDPNREFTGEIEVGAQKCRKWAEILGRLSRPESEALSVPFRKVFDDVEILLSSLASKKHVELHSSSSPELGRVICEPWTLQAGILALGAQAIRGAKSSEGVLSLHATSNDSETTLSMHCTSGEPLEPFVSESVPASDPGSFGSVAPWAEILKQAPSEVHSRRDNGGWRVDVILAKTK